MRAASSATLHRTRFAVAIALAVLLLAAGAVSKSSTVSDILALKIFGLLSSAKRCYSDYGICVSRQKSFKTTFFRLEISSTDRFWSSIWEFFITYDFLPDSSGAYILESEIYLESSFVKAL